jgi:5'-3' exonuclease
MLAIIDGDVLAYHACRERPLKEIYLDEDGNRVNRLELDEDGKRIPPKYSKEEDRAYLESSWRYFKSRLSDLVDQVKANEFVMAVKGPDNFRNIMYTQYKMNRHADPNKQNNFVPIIRKLAVQEDLAIESVGREADDLIRIWAEQAKLAGEEYVVCSIDKDLLCIPGLHFRIHKNDFLNMSEADSCRFYYEQLLKGDPTDNIPGVPRVGEVKATQILKDLSTEEEFQEAVVDAYIKAYGDDWHSYLLSNGKMLYLQKHEDDYFSVKDWEIVKELL